MIGSFVVVLLLPTSLLAASLSGGLSAHAPGLHAFNIRSISAAEASAPLHRYGELQAILSGPDSGRIDRLQHWFDNGPRIEAEVAAAGERVAENGFRVERGLLTRNALDVATSYQDLMSPGFIPRVNPTSAVSGRFQSFRPELTGRPL